MIKLILGKSTVWLKFENGRIAGYIHEYGNHISFRAV